MKKTFAAFLCLFLCLTFLPAMALEFPQDAVAYLLPEGKAGFNVQLSIDSMAPYGQEMLDGMNALLPHLSLNAQLDEDQTDLSFLVDGEESVTLHVQTEAGRECLTTPQLPGRSLYSTGDALAALFPAEAEDRPYAFDLSSAMAEAKEAYPALMEAITPYATSKSANYTIKNVGKAGWVLLAKLNKDQSAELYDPLMKVLLSGLNEEYRTKLEGMSFLKGLTVAVYSVKEGGDVMAVYISGNVKHPNRKTFKLNYLFAFTEKASSYKLELGSGKSGGVKIAGLVKSSSQKDKYELDESSSSEFRALDGKTTWKTKDTVKLNGKASGGGKKLSGTILHSLETSGEDKVSSEEYYEIDLTAKDSELQGKIGIRQTKDKDVLCEVALTFQDPVTAGGAPEQGKESAEKSTKESAKKNEPAASKDGEVTIVILDEGQAHTDEEETEDEGTPESKSQKEYQVGSVPVGMKSYTATQGDVDLDKLGAEERAALQDELYQNAAAKLLVAILTRVPEKDLTLLQDAANAEGFAALLKKVKE